jgi:hypothetical protein
MATRLAPGSSPHLLAGMILARSTRLGRMPFRGQRTESTSVAQSALDISHARQGIDRSWPQVSVATEPQRGDRDVSRASRLAGCGRVRSSANTGAVMATRASPAQRHVIARWDCRFLAAKHGPGPGLFCSIARRSTQRERRVSDGVATIWCRHATRFTVGCRSPDSEVSRCCHGHLLPRGPWLAS